MEFFWNTIIPEFCKVGFLCYFGEPNWLGWIVFGFGSLFGLLMGLSIIAGILQAISD
jgi:hypothetical protein